MKYLASTTGLIVALAACSGGLVSGSGAGSAEPGGTVDPGAPTASDGAPTASDGASTASPTVSDLVDWDRSEVPYEGCPPDAAPGDTVAFGEPVGAEFGDQGGVVRHGIVANREGELFRIDVFGREDEFVRSYFEELRLCLDAVFTADASAETVEGLDAADVRPEAEVGPADLVIQIALLGLVDPARDPGATAKEIAAVPIDEWAGILRQLEASPDARPDLVAAAYVIDTVIDPGLGQNTTHHYREIWATRVFSMVSVSGGEVRAGLCRNSWNPLRRVTQSATTTGTLSDTQVSWFQYDLAVKGLSSSNRYLLTASWWVPGWNSGYWSLAPSGGLKTCYP